MKNSVHVEKHSPQIIPTVTLNQMKNPVSLSPLPSNFQTYVSFSQNPPIISFHNFSRMTGPQKKRQCNERTSQVERDNLPQFTAVGSGLRIQYQHISLISNFQQPLLRSCKADKDTIDPVLASFRFKILYSVKAVSDRGPATAILTGNAYQERNRSVRMTSKINFGKGWKFHLIVNIKHEQRLVSSVLSNGNIKR